MSIGTSWPVTRKSESDLEDDIKVHEQKISKLRDQMLQAKTNDQYRAFQNEIGYCETEIRKSEDRILDLMGEAEPLENNAKTAEAALKEEKAKVEAEKQRAEKRTTEDKEFLRQALEERKVVAAAISPRASEPITNGFASAGMEWSSPMRPTDDAPRAR